MKILFNPISRFWGFTQCSAWLNPLGYLLPRKTMLGQFTFRLVIHSDSGSCRCSSTVGSTHRALYTAVLPVQGQISTWNRKVHPFIEVISVRHCGMQLLRCGFPHFLNPCYYWNAILNTFDLAWLRRSCLTTPLSEFPCKLQQNRRCMLKGAPFGGKMHKGISFQMKKSSLDASFPWRTGMGRGKP